MANRSAPLDLAVEPDERVDVTGRAAAAVRGQPARALQRRPHLRRTAPRDLHASGEIAEARCLLVERLRARDREAVHEPARDARSGLEAQVEDQHARLVARERGGLGGRPVERVQVGAAHDPAGVERQQAPVAVRVDHPHRPQVRGPLEGVGELELVEHVVAPVGASHGSDGPLRDLRDDDGRQRARGAAPGLRRRRRRRHERQRRSHDGDRPAVPEPRLHPAGSHLASPRTSTVTHPRPATAPFTPRSFRASRPVSSGLPTAPATGPARGQVRASPGSPSGCRRRIP
jgi:hypothetical protein